MHVNAGTVLEVNGPIEWSFVPGAQVVNDGRIEFRDSARVLETPGWPITGIGTEHAWMEVAQPVSGFQPGGLGLELTSATSIGPLEIVRGHQPKVMANAQESVARWFGFAEGIPPALDQLVFRFDETELNGLDGSQLNLHDAETAEGPWVPMSPYGGLDPFSLIAYDLMPREYITAFHTDAATSIREEPTDQLFSVWPAISADLVHVNSISEDAIDRLELFDLFGAQLPLNVQGSDRQMILDLSQYPQGPLFLRVNGRHVFKLIKT